VALSNPCYELWSLLHLVDTGEMFINCAAVIERLAKEWQGRFKQAFGPKAQADYSKIIEDRMAAVARARKHHENGDQSWTEVYLVVEDIERRIASQVAPDANAGQRPTTQAPAP
jgi:hypothetical protein